MIRDGVRLLWALENNNLAVLFELFPHLQKQFIPEGADLLEQFRQMLLQPRPVETPAASLPQGPQPLAGFKSLPLPVDDDDEQDTIILKRSTSTDAGKNFLGSLASFR